MHTVVQISSDQAKIQTRYMSDSLDSAIDNRYQHIVVLTHVPPWQATHVYNGAPGSAEAAPWFVSPLMAELLESVADANPHIDFTVLCGHTHGRTSYRARFNMICKVAGADYGCPTVEDVLEIE